MHDDGVADDVRELPTELVGDEVIRELRGDAQGLRMRDLLQELVLGALLEHECVELVPPDAGGVQVVGARQRTPQLRGRGEAGVLRKQAVGERGEDVAAAHRVVACPLPP